MWRNGTRSCPRNREARPLVRSLEAAPELGRAQRVNILCAGILDGVQKKIGGDESFAGAAASLLPAKDLTVSARIENDYGTGVRAFSPCGDVGYIRILWEIHRVARIPPRAEPVPFGQNENVVAAHPPEAKLSYQCVSGASLTTLGRNGGISGGFD